MPGLYDAGVLASVLAGLSAAAIVIACFFRHISQGALSAKHSVIYQKLLRQYHHAHHAETRSVRRAQDLAIKAIAQQGKTTRYSQLENRISAAGLSWHPKRFLTFCIMIGLALFVMILSTGSSSKIALFGACLGGWLLPQRYLGYLAGRRRLAFLKAFSPAIDMIIRGARSGLSLMDCLKMVASDAASPVREEFQSVIAQLGAGVALSSTMEKMARAIPAPEVRFFALVMAAQSQSGGNLTDALSNLSTVLHQRERIAAKIRIASAEGRLSSIIIGILPFMVIGASALLAPDYIAFLWRDEGGREIAVFSLLWLMAGIAVLIRMARIEV